MRSYELRLNPTLAQRSAFDEILRDSYETYNAALQERQEAWKLERKSITLYEQYGELTELRKEPQYAVISVDIQREPLRRVDRAFKAFFRRCKSGEKPGYPRFKSRYRYNSFAWGAPRLSDSALHVPNLGRVRLKAHRAWQGTPKQITVKRVGGRWVGRLICDIGSAPAQCMVTSQIGIDLGVTTLVTLSDGSTIQNPRFVRKYATAIARANRNLVRKKQGSRNRMRAKEVLRRVYQRMADARKNYCHHVSKQLVASYDLIAHEDLRIRNMARGNLAKSILDAAWGILLFQLAYKAESAGRHVIAVNPRNTSQTCSGCGVIVRKTLDQRWHSCVCGTNLGRDHNAAINILNLAPGRGAVGSSAEGSSDPLPRL